MVDVVVEGGREQERLVFLVHAAQEPLDLRQEAHVGHAVGFVEHDRADVGDVDLAAVAEVDQATGSRDHHVDDLVEGADVGVEIGAAVDGAQREPDGCGQRREHLGDLHGQLARRHEHEGARVMRTRAGRGALQQRQTEGQRLA